MPLQIDMRKERSITVIRVVGSIFHNDGAVELRQCLVQRVEEGEFNLLLEVHAVNGMDQAGVDALSQSQIEAKEAGGDIKISGARYWFLATMALYLSRDTFPYYGASEDAFASFDAANGTGPRGVRHFDILEFVKEQEAEEQKNAAGSIEGSPAT